MDNSRGAVCIRLTTSVSPLLTAQRQPSPALFDTINISQMCSMQETGPKTPGSQLGVPHLSSGLVLSPHSTQEQALLTAPMREESLLPTCNWAVGYSPRAREAICER